MNPERTEQIFASVRMQDQQNTSFYSNKSVLLRSKSLLEVKRHHYCMCLRIKSGFDMFKLHLLFQELWLNYVLAPEQTLAIVLPSCLLTTRRRGKSQRDSQQR